MTPLFLGSADSSTRDQTDLDSVHTSPEQHRTTLHDSTTFLDGSTLGSHSLSSSHEDLLTLSSQRGGTFSPIKQGGLSPRGGASLRSSREDLLLSPSRGDTLRTAGGGSLSSSRENLLSPSSSGRIPVTANRSGVLSPGEANSWLPSGGASLSSSRENLLSPTSPRSYNTSPQKNTLDNTTSLRGGGDASFHTRSGTFSPHSSLGSSTDFSPSPLVLGSSATIRPSVTSSHLVTPSHRTAREQHRVSHSESVNCVSGCERKCELCVRV